MSEPGWTVNSHAHSFEEAAEEYYAALIEDPDAPMPEWLAWIRGES